MKFNKRTRILVLAMILCVSYAVGAYIIVGKLIADEVEDGASRKSYVAVITKSTTSDFWKEVYSGVSAAATEYNLEVTFDGPDNEEDYETQNEMLLEAAANGAEVIVFSAVDYNANAETVNQIIAQGVQVISIDSDVNSNMVSARIGTDNYNAGVMAGEAALESKESVLKIGIVNFDENSANGQEREAGFVDTVLSDERVEIVETINVISTTQAAAEGTKEMLELYPEINTIVTFNEWTSLGVGAAIEELGLGEATHVVAFDNNVVSVGMLETGIVDALIVQNPFAMGYLGVEKAYQLINNIEIEDGIDTATTTVTKENMFEEEYQRILFLFE